MLRSIVAIVWPELANAGPTMLENVALKCWGRLAGAIWYEVNKLVHPSSLWFSDVFVFVPVAHIKNIKELLLLLTRGP